MKKYYVMQQAARYDKDGRIPIPKLVAGPLILDQAEIARDRLTEAEGRSTDGSTIKYGYSLVEAMQ